MSDGHSTYEIDIKTAADLKAAEAYKRSIDQAQKSAKDAGIENAELAKRLEAVDKALTSNAARALKLSENLKCVSEAAKGLHEDIPSGISEAIRKASQLIRNTPSGTYYARVRIKGKLINAG